MCNLKELEKLRQELEELIQSKGVEDQQVLEVSQKLDLFIVRCYEE